MCGNPITWYCKDWLLGTSFQWLWGHFVAALFCSATALKVRLTTFPQKPCRQNPPSSWQAVGHHLQHSNILSRFFSLVIFCLEHFNNLFYNLVTGRGVPGQSREQWEASRSSAAFSPWHWPRTRRKHLHSFMPFTEDFKLSGPSFLFYRSDPMPQLINCKLRANCGSCSWEKVWNCSLFKASVVPLSWRIQLVLPSCSCRIRLLLVTACYP